MAPPPSRWPAIRAALLAVMIGLNLLHATPSPQRVTEATFHRPEAREELNEWYRLLGSLGLDIEKATIKQYLMQGTNLWHQVRSTALRPFRRVRKTLGVHQSWALFARPDTFPTVMVIEVFEDARWVEIYRSLHPDHDFLKRELRFRRMRGVHDATSAGRKTAFRNMADWALTQALEAHPDARQARVRMLRTHVTRPGQPPDPKQKVRLAITRKRAELSL